MTILHLRARSFRCPVRRLTSRAAARVRHIAVSPRRA